MKRLRFPSHLVAGAAAAVFFTLALTRSEAHAHGGPIPLEDWGGFTPPTARCQRIIGHAAARCALRASGARRDCLDRTIRGLICDEPATDAAILTARRDALDEIDLYCSDNQAQTLGYLGLFELQADIIRFCREWEDLVASAVYDPVLPIVEPLDSDSVRCVTGVSAGVAKLVGLVFRTWRGCLDRIATRPYELSGKESLVAAADNRVLTLESPLAAALIETCGGERFESIYDTTPAGFASYIQVRASCFAPAFYVQDETVCPPTVCGNGIVEPGEGCDDGNMDNGDGCSAECVVE